MRVFVLVLMVGCWRGATPVPASSSASSEPEPASFVARVTALVDLQRETAALEPRLANALRRIYALATEAERRAIRDELHALAGDVEHLSARARGARRRGGNASAIASLERKLGDASTMVDKLRDGLRLATSIEQLQALALQRAEHGSAADGAIPPTDRIDIVFSPAVHGSRWPYDHLDRHVDLHFDRHFDRP